MRAAEANLHSASARIGVAVANRLPNVTLTANAGSTAFDISKLLSPETGFWTIAGSVAQPIFHGGALLHRGVRRARDLRPGGGAISQHRHCRVSERRRCLDRDQDRCRRLAEGRRRRARRGKSLTITRQRLQLGDINYLALLNAQQTYQQALINLVQAQANRYADTAALFQALGGGWWNRNDVQPDRDYPYFSIFR